jgi:hypothetical protein
MRQMTVENFELARRNLSLYVLQKAEELTRALGIGYIDSSNAPNDYDSLIAKWKECISKGKPMPVWDGASDSTVYTSAGANYAFRFWHDFLHYYKKLDFTTDAEVDIGIMQTKEVQKYFGMDSLEAKIMLADTVGQSLYALENNGEFPDNQISYVWSLLKAQK